MQSLSIIGLRVTFGMNRNQVVNMEKHFRLDHVTSKVDLRKENEIKDTLFKTIPTLLNTTRQEVTFNKRLSYSYLVYFFYS